MLQYLISKTQRRRKISANQDNDRFTTLAEARLVEEPSCNEFSKVFTLGTFQQSLVTAANQTSGEVSSTSNTASLREWYLVIFGHN